MPSIISSSPPRALSLDPPSGLSTLPADLPIGCNTLISCFDHMSLSSLPGSPTKPRFPAPVVQRDPTPLGTREQQRRIYLGPKLSDRATGGPDAGPLIERFSCLFKDREWGQLAKGDGSAADTPQSTTASSTPAVLSRCTSAFLPLTYPG